MSVRKIVRISLTSRLIVFLLQLLFNSLFGDHNADAFKGFEFDKRNESAALDRIVYNCLDGLNKWDARYFITIGKFNYQDISWIAFFPLYPLFINLTANTLSLILNFNYPTVHFLSAYAINALCFLVSCIVLYKLTICLFNDKLFAINTVKWFAYNPASIFFSATYTESLYSALILCAIWLLYQRFPKIQREQNFDLILFNSGRCDKYESKVQTSKKFSQMHFEENDEYVKLFSHKMDCELIRRFLNEKCKFLIAILLLTLASLTRSNGVVNVGFFWYLFLLDNFKSIFYRRIGNLLNFNNFIKFFVLVVSTLLVISPFFAVQYVHHNRFCRFDNSSMVNSVLVNEQICSVPFWKLYSFVQEKYWSVGLFRYYQVQKLPNFLLASPMLILVMFILKYFIESSKSSSNLIKSGLGGQYWNRTTLLFPFIVHLLFLTLFSLLFINIEVLTRLICSSSPIVFWSACKLPRKQQNYVKLYFGLYFFVGTFAFSNFLPWT